MQRPLTSTSPQVASLRRSGSAGGPSPQRQPQPAAGCRVGSGSRQGPPVKAMATTTTTPAAAKRRSASNPAAPQAAAAAVTPAAERHLFPSDIAASAATAATASPPAPSSSSASASSASPAASPSRSARAAAFQPPRGAAKRSPAAATGFTRCDTLPASVSKSRSATGPTVPQRRVGAAFRAAVVASSSPPRPAVGNSPLTTPPARRNAAGGRGASPTADDSSDSDGLTSSEGCRTPNTSLDSAAAAADVPSCGGLAVPARPPSTRTASSSAAQPPRGAVPGASTTPAARRHAAAATRSAATTSHRRSVTSVQGPPAGARVTTPATRLVNSSTLSMSGAASPNASAAAETRAKAAQAQRAVVRLVEEQKMTRAEANVEEKRARRKMEHAHVLGLQQAARRVVEMEEYQSALEMKYFIELSDTMHMLPAYRTSSTATSGSDKEDDGAVVAYTRDDPSRKIESLRMAHRRVEFEAPDFSYKKSRGSISVDEEKRLLATLPEKSSIQYEARILAGVYGMADAVQALHATATDGDSGSEDGGHAYSVRLAEISLSMRESLRAEQYTRGVIAAEQAAAWRQLRRTRAVGFKLRDHDYDESMSPQFILEAP